VIAPNAFKAIEKAKTAKTQKDLLAIKTGVAALYSDTGKFPNGCIAYGSANPEVYFNDSRAGLVARPPVGVVQAPCEWTQAQVDKWDGPYLESRRVTDFWKTPYMFDPDYVPCSGAAASCASTASMSTACKQSCGGGFTCVPPMLVSCGPDKIEYTCDDILVQMTLK